MTESSVSPKPSWRKVSPGRIFPVILFVFFVFFVLQNYFFILQDQSPGFLHSDSERHLQRALENYLRFFREGPFKLIFAPTSYYYPPQVYYVTIPFFKTLGPSVITAIFSQSIFWLALMLSAYFIGRHVKDETTGFLAALLVMTVPYLGRCTREYCLDVPLTAVTGLALLCLLKADYFKDRKWSFLFFFFAGLGLLTKLLAPFYIAGGLIASFAIFCREAFSGIDPRQRKEKVLRLLLVPAAFGLSFILVTYLCPRIRLPDGLFYGYRHAVYFFVSVIPLLAALSYVLLRPHRDRSLDNLTAGALIFLTFIWHFYGLFWDILVKNSMQLAKGGVNTDGLLDFIRKMTDSALGYPVLILTVIGTGLLLMRPEERSRGWLLLCSFAAGLGLLYLFPIKDDRYFLPLLPAMAPVGAAWISSLRGRLLRGLVFGTVILACLLGWVGWLFEGTPLLSPFQDGPLAFMSSGVAAQGPEKSGYAVDDIARVIEMAGRDRRYAIIAVTEGFYPAFRVGNGIFTYMSYLHLKPFFAVNRLGPLWVKRPDTQGAKADNEEAYGYLYMINRPSENELEHYDCFIVVFTHSALDLMLVPPRLQRDLSRAGLSHRPDLIITLGLGPGFGPDGMVTQVMRIPIEKKNME
jgi:hypothetical protein